MAHKYDIVHTSHTHMLELDEQLRQEDVRELLAADGPDTFHSIVNACRMSAQPWTWLVDGRVAMIFGVVPVPGPLHEQHGGAIWALGTPLAGQHPRALMAISHKYLSGVIKTYGRLFGYVDARNERSIRWLKRVGFTLHDAEPRGYSGLPFHLFEMKNV